MRRSLQTALLALLGLALLASAWLWWNRPRQVNMAAYVPADTLIYLEANNLPDVLKALTSTRAWGELAPPAGLDSNYGAVASGSRFVSLTGIGSAEAVALTRAQFAVSVAGVEASEEPGEELRVRPRLALVVETHTGGARALKAVRKLVGDFARRRYGEPKVEQGGGDGVTRFTWGTPGGGRKIVAVVDEGVVVIANDDGALEACLAVRRGEKASLADDQRLAEMRTRVGAAGALAFGYVPQSSAPKLAQIAALVLAGQSFADAREQSGLAILVPQLAGRLVAGGAWASRPAGPGIEDFYFFAVPPEITTRLAVALETKPAGAVGAAQFLPADAHQLTRYHFPEPEAAWGGLNAVISSQLDPTVAPFAVGYLGKMLEPFGVSAPREFLRAVGPEVTTARLEEGGEGLLMIARVRDDAALRGYLKKHLGAGARAARAGDAELYVSPDPDLGAAALVSGHVILGGEESIRLALEARASGRTLASAESFRRALESARGGEPIPLATFTDDREPARRFVTALARLRGARGGAGDVNAFARALAARPFSVSETRLAADGFERRTLSSFGQFGAVVQLFAAPDDAGS